MNFTMGLSFPYVWSAVCMCCFSFGLVITGSPVIDNVFREWSKPKQFVCWDYDSDDVTCTIRIDYVNWGIAMSAHDRRLQKIQRSKRYRRYMHTCTSSIPTISFSRSYVHIYIYTHIHMELSPVNPGSGELALNAKWHGRLADAVPW